MVVVCVVYRASGAATRVCVGARASEPTGECRTTATRQEQNIKHHGWSLSNNHRALPDTTRTQGSV